MPKVSQIAPMVALFELFHGWPRREKRVPPAGKWIAEKSMSIRCKILN
ncbi:hypothetical protein [Flavobacterium qiangtangense]